MVITNEIVTKAEELEETFHAQINQIIEKGSSTVSYESMRSAVVNLKLAELELRIEKLENGKVDKLSPSEASELLKDIK